MSDNISRFPYSINGPRRSARQATEEEHRALRRIVEQEIGLPMRRRALPQVSTLVERVMARMEGNAQQTVNACREDELRQTIAKAKE